ncbi:MAG: hypothetical protein II767_03190 [Proteobacteria bacterium]|nr:hypothetical protein [Pseudomonadota bacterium]MBQ4359237.1 hypothetical protein [Pseudomonadota bacterium]
MKKSIGGIVILAAMLFSSTAFSDEPKMTSISFEDDRIEGDLMVPNQSNINVKELDELSSLIKAREDFVDEMRKTVDEL